MKRIYKVYKKTVSIVNETPTAMYENLVGSRKGFLLESYDKNYDRYTFLGEPEELISSEGESLVITKKSGEREVRRGNPLALLKEYYDEFEIHKENDELNFSGGLVGNVGYDFIRYSEKLPEKNPDEIGIETVQLMLMKEFIVVDHVAETLTAVILESDDETGKETAAKKAAELIKTAMQEQKESEVRLFPDGVITKKSDTLEEYSEKVNKIKQYIRDGHIFQTVLSQRWTIATGQDGFDLYCELRELNPSPYLYYFNFGDFEVIGSSPEMLVKQQGNKVFTCPIAGTRPRGKTKEEDDRLHRELLADEKERSEHNMLVDLGRNDIGKISRIGTVEVEKYMSIERYSHVMHIGSTVRGVIREDADALDAVDAILPAGTLSGAPKLRACEIINELEDNKRGIYGGAIGYISFTGNLDTCIAIRLAFSKNGKVFVRSGAGIVADSVPEKEYRECIQKAAAVRQALQKAQEGMEA